MIVISTHAMFFDNKDVYGPPHAVSLYLNKKKIDHIFIKHRLEGDGFSKVEYYKKGELVKTIERGYPKRLKLYVQYLFEIFLSIKIAIKETNSCELFVGVDPLNALAGILLKIFGKTKKTVYFSADFALKRFENSTLNAVYLWLDKFGMFCSDQTWSVSRRIVLYRKDSGLKKDRNFFLPNAPFFDDVKRIPYEKTNRYDLVIVSAIWKEIAFTLLVDAFFELRKKIKKARLIIIGSGPEEKNLKRYIRSKKLDKDILFLGTLSHDKMFKVLIKSGVGIALYANANPYHFRYYSDSMKVRDYLASGLPTIISGNTGIGSELEEKHAGIGVKLSKSEIFSAMVKILQKKGVQRQMRENAIEHARNYDTYKLLDQYFSSLGLY